MKTHLDNETEKQINQCLDLLKDVLGSDLLGVYLYGSSIVGGLQKFSDIDLFAVSQRATTDEEKAKFAAAMLNISGEYMKSSKKPIEMKIVVKSEVNPWHYPPNFDFQYGDWLRQDFESGNNQPWSTTVMPDLAIVITQILLASETLLGPDPSQLLDPVPYKDFITATTKEIDSLRSDLDWDTRNVLLTFARIWNTLETDTIRSKPDAASWVSDKLPEEFRSVMKRARAICLGEEDENWDDLKEIIHPCADFMLDQIKEKVDLLETGNYGNRTIKLAD